MPPLAEREWAELDEAVKKRFKSKLLKQRLISPRVAKDALHGAPDLYKIKITSRQYRLAYHVDDGLRHSAASGTAQRPSPNDRG